MYRTSNRSTKYPQSTPKVRQKYPKSIPKVPPNYHKPPLNCTHKQADRKLRQTYHSAMVHNSQQSVSLLEGVKHRFIIIGSKETVNKGFLVDGSSEVGGGRILRLQHAVRQVMPCCGIGGRTLLMLSPNPEPVVFCEHRRCVSCVAAT